MDLNGIVTNDDLRPEAAKESRRPLAPSQGPKT